MPWPPKAGELLPHAAEAAGVRHKLVTYSLDRTNEAGGPKAQGFALILGISDENVEYLEGAIQTGVLVVMVGAVRDNPPYGVNCAVTVPVRGLGDKNERVIDARTVWEITHSGAPPRLVSAYLKP